MLNVWHFSFHWCYYCLFTEESYYLGFFRNYNSVISTKQSIVLMTADQPVFYSIKIPGVRFYLSGVINANNEVLVKLPTSVQISSRNDQVKGIYIQSNNSKITVIGQNMYSSSSDTFLALSISDLCFEIIEFEYFGITVDKGEDTKSFVGKENSIVIVGTANNTSMKLKVTQHVTIFIGSSNSNLIPGREYSFMLNRLQTLYIGSVNDLTGTKIVTDSQVSVLSGHGCANVPTHVKSGCDYLIEQIPPTTLWGKIFYTVPLATRTSYTIKVMAAYGSTVVDFHCNSTKMSFILNEGEHFNRSLDHQEYCAIYSNKKILVVQLGHYHQFYSPGDPMMMLVPATIHYTHKYRVSTIRDPPRAGYKHFVNVIVLAQYYQPNIMYMSKKGYSQSLDTQKWVPTKVNNVIEAYATKLTVSEGVINIIHTNTLALMTTIVYGFAGSVGYGHLGGLYHHAGLSLKIMYILILIFFY